MIQQCSQLAYASELINTGYKEIKAKKSPAISTDHTTLYFSKGNRYAMVDSNGNFINWLHPDETEILKNRKDIEVWPTSWA